MRLHISLRNWLDEQVLQELDLEHLALSNIDWKKLKYLIILLHPFTVLSGIQEMQLSTILEIYTMLFLITSI